MKDFGIDMETVGFQLEEEGVAIFKKSYDELQESLVSKVDCLLSEEDVF